MVVLIAKNTVIQGKQQEFLKIAKEMIVHTRKESGCASYDLVADRQNDQVFYFIEKYVDNQALEAHRASVYFQTLVPQLAELREKASEVSTCDSVE